VCPAPDATHRHHRWHAAAAGHDLDTVTLVGFAGDQGFPPFLVCNGGDRLAVWSIGSVQQLRAPPSPVVVSGPTRLIASDRGRCRRDGDQPSKPRSLPFAGGRWPCELIPTAHTGKRPPRNRPNIPVPASDSAFRSGARDAHEPSEPRPEDRASSIADQGASVDETDPGTGGAARTAQTASPIMTSPAMPVPLRTSP